MKLKKQLQAASKWARKKAKKVSPQTAGMIRRALRRAIGFELSKK